MAIYQDGQEYPDAAAFEAAMNPVIPESLKRVYIPTQGGEVIPPDDTADNNIVSPNKYIKDKEIQSDQGNVFNDQGNIVDYDFSKGQDLLRTMPLGSTEKPADALKSDPGTQVAPQNQSAPGPSNELPQLAPDFKSDEFVTWWKSLSPAQQDQGKLLFKGKTPLTDIYEGDVQKGIDTALNFGTTNIVKAIGNFKLGGYELQLSKLNKEQVTQFNDLKKAFEANPKDQAAHWDLMDFMSAHGKDTLKEYDPLAGSKQHASETPGTPEFNAKYGYSSLENTSPKEASERYWNILTTKGEYSAAEFEQKYIASQKGNGGELFGEHVRKLHADNPYQQIPYENAPPSSIPWPEGGVFKHGGFEIDLNVLTNKQYSDFLKLQNRYYDGTISGPQYKSELKEYHDYSAEKVKNNALTKKSDDEVDKILAEIQKVLDNEAYPETAKLQQLAKEKGIKPVQIPITEGKMESYDYFLKQPEVQKMSKKELFLEGIKQARNELKATLAEIQNKILNKVRAPIGDLISAPKVPPRGDYTEPAYRGMTLHQGDMANPVFNFQKAPEMYSTANPMLADMYAGYLTQHPGIKVPEGTFPHNAQVQPLLINTKDYHYYDAKGEIWQKANKEAIREAKKSGKKGVIVDNVWDEPESTTALGRPNKIYITFPDGATTVKSRFAEKFDPSSPNIMHGIGTIGLGTAATGYVSTEPKE